MATEAASIFINVTTDADKATKDLASLGKTTNKAGASAKGMTGSIIKANVALAAAKQAFNILKNSVQGSVRAFNEQAKVEKQLDTVLKSTQNAAGLTAKEIKNFASSLQGITTFGDEAVIASSNLLLTFKEIGGETFKRAQAAILDVSTAMGQDLKASSIQVGKALNDPIKGLTALSRTGITFTEDQKEVIKSLQETGDIAGAQAIILKELESQFGGSAKAAAETFGGALQQLSNEQGDIAEKFGQFVSLIGVDFVKASTESAKSFNAFLSSEKFINIFADGLARIAGFFQAIKTILTPLVNTIFKELKTTLSLIGDELSEVKGETNLLEPALQALAFAAGLVGVSFKVVAQAVRNSITNLANSIKIVKSIGATLKTFYDLIRGEATFEDLKKSTKEVGASLKEFGTDYVDGWKNIATTAVGGLKEVFDQTKTVSDEALQNFTETSLNTAETIKNSLNGVIDSASESTEVFLSNQEEAFQRASGFSQAFVASEKTTWRDYFDSIGNIANTGVEFLGALSQVRENILGKNKSDSIEAIIFERALAVAQTAINTAVGISNAIATVPYPANIPAAISIGLLGAAQTAAIISTPLPTAQFGGDFSVPVGGANDSALLRVNSGENVSVTPARESSNNSSTNSSRNVIINIAGQSLDGVLEERLNSGNVFIQRSGVIDQRAVV